ncbi:hypothetical protein C2G38_2195255 [Gigaspora rosea]|uniref:Uncharacterized protein n=1 Tax=Gigaspora rosea TaxID=44941 RepID=A0A397UVX8_9GLOM|nr:hypothetical protein C2G38_2195255 [Gigaspora rosea]
METRLKDIEEKLNSNFDFSNDKTFKEDVIKSVSKEILTKAIYPEEELIRAELDRYVRSNYKEDYKKNTPNQWNAYYTRNINRPIRVWKGSKKTKDCYKKLFKEIEEGSLETYIARVLKKIWPEEDASEENVVYAIAVAQTILNPDYGKLNNRRKCHKEIGCKTFSNDPLSNPCSEVDSCDEESDKFKEPISNKVEIEKVYKRKNNSKLSEKTNKRRKYIRVSSDEETTNQEDVPEVDINKPVDDDSLASDVDDDDDKKFTVDDDK